MHSRNPLQELRLPRRNTQQNLDRFIPNRSAMDFEYAHYMLTEGRKRNKKPDTIRSQSSEAYLKRLAEALNMNRTRILAFGDKPPPKPVIHRELGSGDKPVKKTRHISQSAYRTLDAPDIVDDFYLNLLDWGCNHVLAIALDDQVYLWDGSNGSCSELVTVNYEESPITSVSWAPDGRHLAIGLDNSHVQLWDCQVKTKIRTLVDGHQHDTRVGALAWNNDILTTGGQDTRIVNSDVRVRNHIVEYYTGHSAEVCGLKWSPSGQQLASGGDDNLLFIWDRSMISSSTTTRCLHRRDEHTGAVKALAWCPFQRNLLASGGGRSDRSIRFWNTHTGACLNSVDSGSQVCALMWNKHEPELLSAHGFTENQLVLWKYPSMKKIAELHGHTSRVLYTAESPNGCTVATAAGDETLRLWNVFGNPKPVTQQDNKLKPEPFPNVARIR